jgi:hypothetical protein
MIQELIGVRREMAHAAGWQSYVPPSHANITVHLTPLKACISRIDIRHITAHVLERMFTFPPSLQKLRASQTPLLGALTP